MAPDTLNGTLAESFRRHADRTAFLRKIAGRYEPISYAQADQTVRRLASSLLDLGTQPGDRVAILSGNSPEWVYADLAALAIGASTVPIYPTLNPGQVRYILSDSESRVVFVSHRAQMEKVEQVRGELPRLENVVVFDPKDIPDSVLSLADLLEKRPGPGPEAVALRIRAVGPDDLASLIYTSGTTGEPKGVMLTHRAFSTNALTAATLFDIGPGDVALSFLPLSHVFERTAGYYAMLARGVTIAYAESVDTVPQNLLEILR
ncbi:MAG: AMP-binding protein, partial [Armatimonadetes bacterium]|nr:AMP-binding protein [Armatimonadota bacterium]